MQKNPKNKKTGNGAGLVCLRDRRAGSLTGNSLSKGVMGADHRGAGLVGRPRGAS